MAAETHMRTQPFADVWSADLARRRYRVYSLPVTMERDPPIDESPNSSRAQPSGGRQPAVARRISTRSLVTEQLEPESAHAEPISSTGQRQAAEGDLRPSPVADEYIGRIIDGRYLVEALIGEGGMGVIYQCRHRIIGKKLAMKIIRREQARAPEAPQRFLIEARAASAIGSEHIIHVSDFGRLPDGAAYLVMEFLEGAPLSRAIQSRKPLSLGRVLSIGIQLAEGLSAAHQAGIVHRDLKPENIFLVRRHDDREFVKILDFGVAQMNLDGARKLTRAGCIIGTPHYMSPEQAGAERVDQRGDIYSLGIILYELICGRVPFDGDNYRTILSQHLLEPPAPFSRVAPWLEVPAGLEQIVRRCLEKQPNDRYGSMAELCAELRACEGTLFPRDGKSSSSLLGPPPSDLETGIRAVPRTSKLTVADGIPRARFYAAGAALGLLLASLAGWVVLRGPAGSASVSAAGQPAPSIATSPPTPPPPPAVATPAGSLVPFERDALVPAPSSTPSPAPRVADSSAPRVADSSASVAPRATPKAARSTPRASRTQARRKPRAGKPPARRSKAPSELVNPWTAKR
jgi:serine/threonine protein kinase